MERRKKVLFLITKSNFGGAQRYVYDLATNVPPEFEPVAAGGGSGLLFERLKDAGIRTVSLPSLGRDVHIFSDIKAFFEVLSLVRNERPDVLHLNSSKIGALGALAGRLLGIRRIIFTAHGWAFEEDRAWLSRTLIKAISWFTILLSHRSIAVSEKMRDEMRRLPGTGGVTVIHNGIKITDALSRSEAKQFFVTKGVPSEGLLVGTIAELHPIKGLSYAIEAISKLRERGERVTFVIMGEGEERDRLEKLIRERQLEHSVFLLGFVPDAAKYLSGLDVFTMTSLYEGFNYAILEAGSAHVPVVASRAGGIPEILEDGAGILVSPRDSAAIADAIARFGSSEEERTQSANSLTRRVQERFSLETMLASTVALYRE